jgi:hypothetical protein
MLPASGAVVHQQLVLVGGGRLLLLVGALQVPGLQLLLQLLFVPEDGTEGMQQQGTTRRLQVLPANWVAIQSAARLFVCGRGGEWIPLSLRGALQSLILQQHLQLFLAPERGTAGMQRQGSKGGLQMLQHDVWSVAASS